MDSHCGQWSQESLTSFKGLTKPAVLVAAMEAAAAYLPVPGPVHNYPEEDKAGLSCRDLPTAVEAAWAGSPDC